MGKPAIFFEFAVWYDDAPLAARRWREAPPLAEVQDEREIRLEGMLTRSALMILTRFTKRMPTRLTHE
eukprot:835101-Pyramimonas_sp.AAC.1